MAEYRIVPSKQIYKRSPFSLFPEFFQNFETDLAFDQKGLSVSEDKQNIYVEASMPGLKTEEIDVTLDKGVLQIKGQKKEETQDPDRKFYSKEERSYWYQVALPNQIDDVTEPKTQYESGVLHITFTKAKQSQTKKIQIQKGK